MDSALQRTQRAVSSEVTKLRWAIGLSGALAIAFGVAIIIWPNISLESLVIVFGAYAFASGVVGLVTAFSGPMTSGRGWLVLSSLAGIVTGVLTFVWTDMSALALLYVIGAYAIALGVITIGGAFWLPLETDDAVVLSLAGLVSILFGVVMFAEPGDGALVLLALIAAFMLVTGFTQVAVAIGGKRLLVRRPEDSPA